MLRNVSANIAIQSDQSHFVSPYEAPNKGRMFNLCSTAQRVCCAVVLCQTIHEVVGIIPYAI